MQIRLAIHIIASIALISQTACFTGVESTPKITAGEVKRHKVTTTPEQLLLANVTPQPLTQWEPGKEFYVTDNKIRLAFNPTSHIFPDLAGKIIKFKEAKSIPSITGDEATELHFTVGDSIDISYRINTIPEELTKRSTLDIPFAIDMSLVHEIDSILRNRPLWIMTSTWYNTEEQAVNSPKFVAVNVTNVEPGNLVYPIKVNFLYNQQPFSVFMSIGKDTRAIRSFAGLFSLSDPRKIYQNITDETWLNIVNSRVSEGMTRDECRLALGAPKEIDRASSYSSFYERWTYENGIYLIFEDGILSRYRK